MRIKDSQKWQVKDRATPRLKYLGEPGEEVKGFVCPVCGRVFEREGALLRHERTHEPEPVGTPAARFGGKRR